MSTIPINKSLEDMKRDQTVSLALGEATKYGIVGGIASLIATIAATKYSPKFNKYMSISAKTSLPVMTAMFLFGLQYELKLHDMMKFPNKYGIISDEEEEVVKKMPIIPFHHRVINYIDDHPIQLIAGLSAPLLATVLNQQLALKNLKFSQRILHSRVYAQVGVIGIIVMVFGLKDYASRYRIYYDEKEED
eukprot:CAMPEP_0196767572 /NCGR_PEP_ID=MMETSP1095-20130614/41749_1 /TAXON_ID=96789 ORGANISM="Chromulina nebulosa, Strain UTEXLB2642" /NCGR_SAMPLE_ID=MMETSP1095 /ASSEMBLY_ACC=CAM_ASM_000446 /LENGTH=190 /DNA_ID=CAMNT_0042136017 /DNA_START=65 /DNA_END=637 /DNA_ORIENTATION=+